MTKLERSLKDGGLIDIGDKVTVFCADYSFDAIVKYKACQTGDCWIFEELDIYDAPKAIQYIQNFVRITKYVMPQTKDVPF